MQIAYCPQCAAEICGEGKKFCFSYSGLFNDPNKTIKYHIAENIDFSDLIDKDTMEFKDKNNLCKTLRENGMPVTAEFLMNGNSEKAKNIIAKADRMMMSVSFDMNKEQNINKYVFASELYDLIHKEVISNNRVVDFLLSTEFDTAEDLISSMESIDLIQFISRNTLKYDEFNRCVSRILTPEERKIHNKSIEGFEKIKRICDLFSKKSWTIKLDRGFQTLKTMGTDNMNYLTGLSYNGVNCVKRICPNCGAHVSSYLGVYKQKIISFIGTPTSGKSTFINAIYYKLRQGVNQITGVGGRLNQNDPYYKEYEQNANRMEQKLTVKKTDKGIFPVLYALISDDNDPNKKGIYTFVDVPGEYFAVDDTQIAMNDANLNRISVMKHSDVLCTVIAIEQLLGFSPTPNAAPATLAEITDGALQNYNSVCNKLQEKFNLKDSNCEIILLISKADAIPAEKLANGKLALNQNGEVIPTNVAFSDYDNLSILKRTEDGNFYDKQNNLIVNGELVQYVTLSKKIMEINNVRWKGIITQIMQNITGSDNADNNVFFVSSYGFYAINDINALSKEEKINALTEFDFINEDKGQAEKILEIYERNVSKTVVSNANMPEMPVVSSKNVSKTVVSNVNMPEMPAVSSKNVQRSKSGRPELIVKKASEIREIHPEHTEYAVPETNKEPDIQPPVPVMEEKTMRRTGRGRRGVSQAPSRAELQNGMPEQIRPAAPTHPVHEQAKADISAEQQKAVVKREEDKEKDLLKEKNRELQQINEMLSCESVEKRFIDYYKNKHNADSPEGINALLYFFLNKTRFILSDADKKQIESLRSELGKYKDKKEEIERRMEGVFARAFTRVFGRDDGDKNSLDETMGIIKRLEEQIKKYEF